MISSKRLELEQLKQEFKDISVQIQEAKKKQMSGTSSKKRGKGTDTNRKVRKNNTATHKTKATNNIPHTSDNTKTTDEDVISSENQSSFIENTLFFANNAGTFIVENRSYVLFVAFAAAIHMFGDYASV